MSFHSRISSLTNDSNDDESAALLLVEGDGPSKGKRSHLEGSLIAGDCMNKREHSTNNASEYQSVSENIKRLAISFEGHPEMSQSLKIKYPNPSATNSSVFGPKVSAQDDFNSHYEIVREIGKGGFSTVYRCKNRETGLDYAVKVVDLRPLRLRERFNPTRLKREVDIMRRLNHPNIIKFVQVYEDVDHLMMVMEFCPGRELFDVILARKCFQEDDARPVFAQIARALFYLHSLNILHRDIKPENVLIMTDPDSNGYPIAKLLDFGLSKNAANGSAAKTFVGTPCYLAPEVEYTSKGLGGTYGLPADCWSLGAVLYVMLVARFPEFEQDITGKVVVKLPPVLFNNISNEAKDLIRGLMNTNPAARLTSAGALLHPWLGCFGATIEELTRVSVANSAFSQHLQEEEAAEIEPMASSPELTASGTVVHHQAMVLRTGITNVTTAAVPVSSSGATPAVFGPENLQLAPLLHLQKSIASCFEEAHAQYADLPEVAASVRKGASLCRQQLIESTQMLRRVEQTAKEVLNMFPDLELAVEEEEPALAAEFFNLVKQWVVELREQVGNTQKLNKQSMAQIQKVVEHSSHGLHNRRKQKAKDDSTVKLPVGLLDALLNKLQIGEQGVDPQRMLLTNETIASSMSSSNTGEVALDSNQVLELFLALFNSGAGGNPQPVELPDLPLPAAPVHAQGSSDTMEVNGSDDAVKPQLPPRAGSASSNDGEDDVVYSDPEEAAMMVPVRQDERTSPRAARKLSEALLKLRQVDLILEQLSVFWANTEVVLELLTKKGQHVEQFIGFASKPRLMARFRERMEEYKRFWEGVRIMCSNYVAGVQTTQERQPMYGFLGKNDVKPSSADASSNEGSFDSGMGNSNNFFGSQSQQRNEEEQQRHRDFGKVASSGMDI